MLASRRLVLLAAATILSTTLATPRADARQAPPEVPPGDLDQARELREDMRRMMALARDRVFPALVNIEVITASYWGGQERKGQSVGSGTIISPDGYILTNYHVVENGKDFTVTLSDKQEIAATLVGEDPLTDLAVLKINPADVKQPGNTQLPFASFGDSDAVEIGDTVMAMGSPWALSRSVTRGSVSNTDRILAGGDDEAGELYLGADQRTGLFNQWIQHDASINPGNSGGPLVNLSGEIVGVNTRGSGGGIAFAIPSNVARQVAELLIQQNEVPRSWYGVSVKAIKNTGYDRGVLVTSVVEDSPAHKGGFQAGDLIVAVNGEPVTLYYPEQIPLFLRDLADKPVGQTVRFTVERDGDSRLISVQTEKMQRDRGDETALRTWGFSVKEITPRMARLRRLDSTDGAIISGMRSGSPAAVAEPSLSPGDVIVRVADRPVTRLNDIIAAYRDINELDEIPEFLLLEFERDGKSQVTLIEPRRERDDDPPRELPDAWIGIATQPVLKNLAEQLGHPDDLGFRITRVYPRTKAADTDLRAGDLIVAINNESLEPRGMQDAGLLRRKVERLAIGDEATLTVLRDGARTDINVPLESTRLEPSEARRERNEDFEFSVREVTFFDRDQRRWDPDVKGVLVTSVEPAGWAGLGGLQAGDLIQRINEYDIKGIKSFRNAMDQIAENQPERVVFFVRRGVSTNFLFAEPEWKPDTADTESNETAANN